MELRHLRYFKAVAELLNFSRAAEQLRVTQPALSRQVRALEEELGATLLDRNHARVLLTDAGRTYYAHTCKILAQVDMAAEAVKEVNEGSGGELIVSNDWHLGGRLVPASLNEFRRKFPRAEVVLHDRRLHDQVALISARRVHIGFVARELLGTRDDFDTLLLLRARLGIVFPPGHRFAARQEVRLAELAEESWLVIDRKESPQYLNFLTRLCRWSGFTPKTGATATTLEGLIGRIASGYGIALMPEHIVPPLVDGMTFALTDCAPIELCAVWHKQEQSKLLHQYLEILRRYATQAEANQPVAKKRR